VGFLMGCTAFI